MNILAIVIIVVVILICLLIFWFTGYWAGLLVGERRAFKKWKELNKVK